MSMLEAALAYAARGWRVFPLKPGDKRPLTPNGFKDAATDEATIREWWGICPQANVGIATGAVSGLFVFDVDKKSGGLETLDTLPLDGEFVLYEVATGGGGIHYYFQHPGFEVKNKAGIFPGIDIRGDGGYVVAPPSVTDDVYTLTAEVELPPSPKWLLDALRPEEKLAHTGPAVELAEGERGDLNKRTLRFLVNGAAGGRWHEEFYQAAMDLKQNGYSYDEAFAKLERITGHLDTSHDIPQLDWVWRNGRTGPPNAPAVEGGASEAAAPGLPPGVDVEDEEPLDVRAASLVDELHAYLSDEGLVMGESTGIPGLDVMLCGQVGGGLRPGDLVSLTAVAKTGKSTLLHKMIHSLVSRGIPVGYASREMNPASEVLTDLLSIELKRDIEKATYTPESKAHHLGVVSKWPLHFAGGYMNMPLERLKEWVLSLKAQGVTHFFGDHVHLFVDDSEDFKLVANYLRQLKRFVLKEKVNFVMVVQPKNPSPDGKLTMHSMRGGANLNQIFNAILMMERHGERGQNLSRVWLEAARFKLANAGMEIYLQYDRETRDLEEVSIEQEPIDPAPPTPGNFSSKFRVIESA
jgi:archaellum biogenesis ATPase FlaH